MFSSIVIVVVVLVFVMVLMFYKRDMLREKFSINITSSTQHFQEQLEQTADIVIKRLEEQITHLEYLLEEANTKIINLDNKIQDANTFMKKEITIKNEEVVEHKIITHLEYLLEEANTKIINLDNKIQNADNFFKKENTNIDENLHQEIVLVANKELEENIKVTHLEHLLEEIGEKISNLDNKIQETDSFFKKETIIKNEELKENLFVKPDEELEEYKTKNLHANPINNIAMATNNIVNLSIEDYKDMARNDKRSSIIAMTELGYDINQIAKTTGISKGEIMLLLQLNKK